MTRQWHSSGDCESRSVSEQPRRGYLRALQATTWPPHQDTSLQVSGALTPRYPVQWIRSSRHAKRSRLQPAAFRRLRSGGPLGSGVSAEVADAPPGASASCTHAAMRQPRRARGHTQRYLGSIRVQYSILSVDLQCAILQYHAICNLESTSQRRWGIPPAPDSAIY